MSKVSQSMAISSRIGFAEAIGCQIMWGLMPVFWRLLSGESALLVLASRMAWSAVFILLLCSVVRRVRFAYLLGKPAAVRTFLATGLITTMNWGVYIWATNSGHLLECSIGYYLCPLVNIAFGVVLFKERMTPAQKLAAALAAVGVAFFIATHGGVIWVSFALALTFAMYGAVKKRGGYPALPGMAVESLITGAIGAAALVVGLFVPSLWNVVPATPDSMAVSGSIVLALLVVAGILTAIPLLLYSAAANRIPMVAIGFIQYVSPTISLVLAVAFFGEEFTLAHGVCFGLVWLGIAAVGAETALRAKRENQE